jgi:glycerol-3-phosphate dehydrogenase
VVVTERSAPAAGTSSRSSSLIHGGLRYLEQGEIGLVRECLAERARLLRTAPSLVRLADFHLPAYDDGRRPAWQLRLGLAGYALLAGLGPGARFRELAPHERPDDGLETRGLRALFRYHDALTDDAALTRAVLASACALGATLRCPARVTALELLPAGVRAVLASPDGERALTVRCVVNAAGPWLPEVHACLAPAVPALSLQLVRGSHVELPARPMAGPYYLESPRDGRPLFVMPREGRTLVGTTEVVPGGVPDQVAPSGAEVEYLLEAVARRFPAWAAQGGLEVREAWAGLRVLPSSSRPVNAARRETRLVGDPEGRWLAIVGGKLTNHARTAAKAVARLARTLPPRRPVADPFELTIA